MSFSFGNILSPSGAFTICSKTRYTGATKRRILTSTGNDWYHGHAAVAHTGVAQYTADGPTVGLPNTKSSVWAWLVMCGQNGWPFAYSVNGVPGTYRDSQMQTYTPFRGTNPAIGINTATGEESEWAVAELITWSRALSQSEVAVAHKHLLGSTPSGYDNLPRTGLTSWFHYSGW